MLWQAQEKSLSLFLFFFPFLFLTSVTMRKRTVVVLHSFCATVLTACVHCSQKVYTCDGGDTRVINNNYRNIANIFQWNCNYSTINTIATTTRKWIKKQIFRWYSPQAAFQWACMLSGESGTSSTPRSCHQTFLPSAAGRILLWTPAWQVMLPAKTVSISSRNEVSQRTGSAT